MRVCGVLNVIVFVMCCVVAYIGLTCELNCVVLGVENGVVWYV
ncbi:hypothetical protein LINPERHAP2_LOCUS21111 [Linum perenne]